MATGRNRIYTLILLFCLAGYIWLFINHNLPAEKYSSYTNVCLIKHVTNVPCPSCGSTRSVLSFFSGDFIGSFYWNPIGILLVIIMITAPVWIIYDWLARKDSFYRFYTWIELKLKQKSISIPLIVLVLFNWIWNIYKGL
jgi:hypothetical protein